MEQKKSLSNPSSSADNFAGQPTSDVGRVHQPAAGYGQHPILPPPRLPAGDGAVQPSVSAQRTLAAPTVDNPLIAGDDDVIEKEWVDKAKKIVSQTKNDPREQEREVSKLQADYLKKRYGKEIKLVSD